MINRNENETCIHLGHGTLIIGRCAGNPKKPEQEDQYYFVENEYSPVGELNDKHTGKTTDELPDPIRLIFDGKESVKAIDMLIRDFKIIRDNLIKMQESDNDKNAE